MTSLTRFLYPVPARRSLGHIVAWWERRRLAYNLVVGATGALSFSVVTALCWLPPNPSPGPPLVGALVYGIFANVCYSLGWMLEGAAHLAWGDEVKPTGPVLFRQGLLFSVGLTCLPMVVATVAWGFRFLRFLW